MFSSYSLSLSNYFLSILILDIQILFVRSVSSLNITNEYLYHKCFVSQGKYKPGSEYEENLKTLFKSVSNRTYSLNNYYTDTTTGKAPNFVHILSMCRIDSYSICNSCIATAAAEFRKRCQRNKGGIIRYDQCSLDVNSARPKVLKPSYENIVSMHNPKNVNGNTKLFDKMARVFLYNLTLQADNLNVEGLPRSYAFGETKFGTKKLYGMVQCVPTKEDCKGCLEWSIRVLYKCCGGKQGARVLGSNCNLRYELYPFLRSN